jgi:hypothetical protein
MRTQHVFRKITWLVQFCALVLAALSAEAANSSIITFQEGKCHDFGKLERLDWTLAKNHDQLYGPDRRAPRPSCRWHC